MTKHSNTLGVLGLKPSYLKPSHAALQVLAASVLITGLAGCASNRDAESAIGFVAPVTTVEQRHPIDLVKARASVALQVPGKADGLNVYQKERIRHFIALWRSEGEGKLVVSGNSRTGLAGLRDLLIERVVPVSAVEIGRYDVNQLGVKLSFARLVARPPKCGVWNSDLGKDSSNTEYENFGCAAQHNLAAMIANPKDLETPRDQVDWTSAARQDFIERAFTAGKATGGDTSATDKAGTISDVAKH